MTSDQSAPKATIESASFNRPCTGERRSGDGSVVRQQDDKLFLAIIDILGHGLEAYEDAVRAMNFLSDNWTTDVTETMRLFHDHMKGTRGAAAGLAVLDTTSGQLSYTGVGNTVIRCFGKEERRLLSADGIVGSIMRDPVVQNLQVQNGDVLILYTDGIRDNIQVADFPQLLYQNVRHVARRFVMEFGKPYDDASCIVLRYET